MENIRRTFDIDIDVSSKTNKEEFGTRAMIYHHEKVMPHPSGYYLEEVPIDPETGLCSFDSEYGDSMGFQKVDLLSNTSYDAFKSKEEIIDCLNSPVNWSLLEDRKIVEKLPHIANHFELCERLSPKSIEDLADLLALIRPGKIHLIDRYIRDKEKVRKVLYKRSKSHYFKKAHAISYASMIVCVLNKTNKTLISF